MELTGMVIRCPKSLEMMRIRSECVVDYFWVETSQDGFFHPVLLELSQVDEWVGWGRRNDFLDLFDTDTEKASYIL